MNSLVMLLAVQCVRAWTWLYTWRMPPALRETRRAEIESDLWEFRSDAAGDDLLGSALHMLLRLLIGMPDDLGWRVEHAVAAGTLTRGSIALGARVAGGAFFLCALGLIDADAGRRRPAIAVIRTRADFDQAGLPVLTAGILATAGVSMRPPLAAQSRRLPPAVPYSRW